MNRDTLQEILEAAWAAETRRVVRPSLRTRRDLALWNIHHARTVIGDLSMLLVILAGVEAGFIIGMLAGAR